MAWYEKNNRNGGPLTSLTKSPLRSPPLTRIRRMTSKFAVQFCHLWHIFQSVILEMKSWAHLANSGLGPSARCAPAKVTVIARPCQKCQIRANYHPNRGLSAESRVEYQTDKSKALLGSAIARCDFGCYKVSDSIH